MRSTYEDVINELQVDGVAEFTLVTGPPTLIEYAVANDSAPKVLINEYLESKTFEVSIADVFNDYAGKIRSYSVIVCELNPFVDHRYYNSRLNRELPSYYKALTFTNRNQFGVWPPYEAFLPCDIFDSPRYCEVEVQKTDDTHSDVVPHYKIKIASDQSQQRKLDLRSHNPLRTKRRLKRAVASNRHQRKWRLANIVDTTNNHSTTTESLLSTRSQPTSTVRTHKFNVRTVKLTIGSKSALECQSVRTQCNGALRPGRYYCVKFRVYSADNWYDSPCSNFTQTVNKIEWTKQMALPLILSLLPFLIFVAVAIYVMMKLRKLTGTEEYNEPRLPFIVKKGIMDHQPTETLQLTRNRGETALVAENPVVALRERLFPGLKGVLAMISPGERARNQSDLLQGSYLKENHRLSDDNRSMNKVNQLGNKSNSRSRLDVADLTACRGQASLPGKSTGMLWVNHMKEMNSALEFTGVPNMFVNSALEFDINKVTPIATSTHLGPLPQSEHLLASALEINVENFHASSAAAVSENTLIATSTNLNPKRSEHLHSSALEIDVKEPNPLSTLDVNKDTPIAPSINIASTASLAEAAIAKEARPSSVSTGLPKLGKEMARLQMVKKKKRPGSKQWSVKE